MRRLDDSLLPDGGAPIRVGDLSALAIAKDLGGLRGSANEMPVAREDTSMIMPFRRIGIVARSGSPSYDEYQEKCDGECIPAVTCQMAKTVARCGREVIDSCNPVGSLTRWRIGLSCKQHMSNPTEHVLSRSIGNSHSSHQMLFLASSNRLAWKFYLPNHRRLHPCFTLERCCVRFSQSSKTFPKSLGRS